MPLTSKDRETLLSLIATTDSQSLVSRFWALKCLVLDGEFTARQKFNDLLREHENEAGRASARAHTWDCAVKAGLVDEGVIALLEPAPTEPDPRIEAAKTGYMAGHHDTVESQYGDPQEMAEDLCREMDDEKPATPTNAKRECRAGHTYLTNTDEPGRCWCGESVALKPAEPQACEACAGREYNHDECSACGDTGQAR